MLLFQHCYCYVDPLTEVSTVMSVSLTWTLVEKGDEMTWYRRMRVFKCVRMCYVL